MWLVSSKNWRIASCVKKTTHLMSGVLVISREGNKFFPKGAMMKASEKQ